jgi:hypothetical protein
MGIGSKKYPRPEEVDEKLVSPRSPPTAKTMTSEILQELCKSNGSDEDEDREKPVEEITFHGYDADTNANDLNTIAEGDALTLVSHRDSTSKVAGHTLTTWGTGYQGGMKLCYQSPSEKLLESTKQLAQT